jgi:hypothetical protein
LTIEKKVKIACSRLGHNRRYIIIKMEKKRKGVDCDQMLRKLGVNQNLA